MEYFPVLFGFGRSSCPLERPNPNAGSQIDVKVVRSAMKDLRDIFFRERDLSNIDLASVVVNDTEFT